MKTPDGEAIEILEQKKEEDSRSPTLLEHEAIILLAEFCKEISVPLFERYENALYVVGNSDKIIGQNQSINYKEKQIFLNARFFTYQFSDAIAILLHEWNHIFGYDGSRIFSDALTEIIAIILKNKAIFNKLPDFEKKWNSFVAKIKNERKGKEKKSDSYNALETLSQEQLKCLLSDISKNDLEVLIRKWGFDIP
jgi:hypothetical protein